MWHLLEAVQFSGSHVWGDLKTVIDFHLSREEMLSQSSLVSSMSFDEPVCLAFVSMVTCSAQASSGGSAYVLIPPLPVSYTQLFR